MSQLKDQYTILKESEMNVYREWKEKCKLCDENEKNRRKIEEKILMIKELEHSDAILKQISEIENSNILSENDKQIIIMRTDKKNYSNVLISYPRYIDLKQITEYVIAVKLKYPKWSLNVITKYGHLDCYPPKSFYNYSFKTELNDIIIMNS